MLESNKTIIAIVFMMFILFFSGSLGLSNKMEEEFSVAQEDEGESNIEIQIPDKVGVDTGTDPIHSDISPTHQLVSSYQGSSDGVKKNMLSVSYSFSAPTLEKIGEYHIPKMSDMSNDFRPGRPMVPAKDVKILLPEGQILSDINLVLKNEVTLDGTYLIKPGEMPATFGSENPSSKAVMLNSSVYESEESYPGSLYSDVSVQTFRGYQILILKLYPMQYIPLEGKVLYFEGIEVIVTTHHTGIQSPLYRGLAEDRNLVETMVDNPVVLATYKSKTEKEPSGGIVPLSITDASESYDYVIITNIALASTFQTLANNKNSSGINTTVVRIEDIYADPDYGFNGSNHQQTIRNFIKDAYINWSISYVLLGGDDEIIPHRGCYGFVFSISGPEEDEDIPTDLYYGGLDGNWDNDGDGIYGEKDVAEGGGGDAGEESDLYAEVFIGRAPVNIPAEAQTFVDKVIYFEANPRPKHVTFHGEEDFNGNKIDDVKDGGDGPLQAPGAETYIPPIYNITHLYESNGDTITKAIWEAEIANDTLFVNHGGHGLVNSYEIQGAGPISYNKGEAAAVLNSYYPIHLSIACYSGAFDGRKPDGTNVAGNDCIAEKYITNPNGGMVACILNSRYGWFTTGDVTAYSGELDNEFYNQLFNNNEMRIGKTLQKVKEEFASNALTHNTYRWVVYEWNLLGDPTMLIFGTDNVTPVADAGPDNSTGTDQPIMLDGSGSTDDSGYIAWYNWTFGDGASFNGSGPKNDKVVHIYTDPGVYTVVLNVSDAWGNWDNDTCNITVWDGTPPNTTLTLGFPKHRANIGDDWNITQTTSFNLTATDEYSGVNFTWYIIDGVYFEYDGTNFTLSGYGEGPHFISWGSEDLSGNNGTTNATFWIDESSPSTQLSIAEPRHPDAPNYGCNVTSFTIFTLLGVDHPSHNSSIAFSWYFIDTDYYEGTIFDLSGYGEGLHTITWGSEDNLGFNESANSIEVWIDDTAPQTTLTIGGPKHPSTPDNGCNVTSATTFTLTPQDYPAHNAGAAFSWYSIGSDYYEGTSFNLSGYPEGQINITWGSEDQLGNNETGNLRIVWLDDSEPITTLSIGLPKFPLSPMKGTNVTSSTPFTLTPQDQPTHSSGVSFTWYTIDANYYEGMQFNLSGYIEGAHIITWGSEDYLSHNETNSITVWLDDSVPITNLTIGPEKFPSYGFDGCNVTSYTKFTLSPIDLPTHNSSVKLIWYTIDGKYYEGPSLGTNFSLSDFGLNEGQHNITWGSIDNLGQNETGNSITVFLDKKSPYTTLKIGEPKWRNLNNEFFNVTDHTPIILNSTDQFSGVAFGWYIINGQYFEGSMFNLSGYDDGAYTIVYGSQDNLSHNETGKSRTIILDTTPPTSTLEIWYPKSRADEDDFWNVTTSTLFTILSNDASSGVEIEWFIIDGEYFEGPIFTLDGYPDGMHTIIWGARDMLGNNKTSNTTVVFIDTHSPITDLTLTGNGYRLNDGDNWNVTSETIFNLTATELYSDVKFTWYIIDGRYFEGINFSLSGYSDGMHSIKWGSVDRLDNNETGNTTIVILDNTPPITDINVGTPKYRSSDDDYWNVTEETTFNLDYADSNSGVDTVWYTIDGVYFEGAEFNLSGYNQGMYTITWGSMDNLKNNETHNSMVVYLDITPPSTILLPGGPKYRSDESHLWNVTQSTLFSLTTSDEYSGISFVWYTIDGVYFEGSELMLIGYDDGYHNITWGAQDNLGNNEEANFMIVNVDTSSPLTTIFIGGEIPTGDERFSMNSSTPVNLSADDDMGVGLDYIWYSLDGGITYNLFESPFTVPVGTGTIIYGARDLLGNNATSEAIRLLVDDREPVIDDDDGEDDGDVEEDPTPAYEEILGMFLDYILYILIIIIALILLLLLLRMRKGKEEEVDFQTAAGQDTAPFQATDDEVEVMAEVKEEVGPPSHPPPPPYSPAPPPSPPPPHPPPPPE